jgi:hypothetical protein
MKSFVAALVAAAVLAVVASLVLGIAQRPAYQAFATSGARVGDPGENLVGKNWNGLNEGRNAVVTPPPHG